MNAKSIISFAFFTLLLHSLAGCSKAPQHDDSCVSALVESRIDKQVLWSPVQSAIDCLLENELSADSAVQVALLNNPEIQALFEDVGIAQADLVDAGLLQNPVIVGLVRFPDQKHASINTEFSIAQNFLDILLIPLRQNVAEAELEQVQLKVANSILNLAYDVQDTYYSLQTQLAKVELMNPVVELFDASFQLAQGQKDQGNINDLVYQSHLNRYLEAKVDLAQTQMEIIRLREKMNRLLGLRSQETCWSIGNELPCLPDEEISMDCLEETALSQRLDLEAARWEVERIARMAGLKEWWAYTDIILGASAEKDAEGTKVIGPTYALTLPIFNYGQADRARLSARLNQSIDRLYALEIDALSQVRKAQAQLLISRNLVLTYQKELLPLQDQLVAMSQKYYNTMSMSVYKLLDAKNQYLQMQISSALTLGEYWHLRVDLERSLGGNLNSGYFQQCPEVAE